MGNYMGKGGTRVGNYMGKGGTRMGNYMGKGGTTKITTTAIDNIINTRGRQR